jgi:acyl carrier protein
MNERELEAWLRQYLSKLLRVRSGEVDVDVPFRQYGLDSTAAVGLSADLSDLMGVDLPDDLADRFQTIRALVEHLATLPGRREDD